MDKEKLERCNKLLKKIEHCHQQIKYFEYSQCENVVEMTSSIRFGTSNNFGIIPSCLFRSIGRIVLNEWKQELIELENKFNLE